MSRHGQVFFFIKKLVIGNYVEVENCPLRSFRVMLAGYDILRTVGVFFLILGDEDLFIIRVVKWIKLSTILLYVTLITFYFLKFELLQFILLPIRP